MKKIFLIIVMVFAYGFSAYAYYEKNHPVTVTQPDGTTVACFITGDEFYHWVHDAAGYTLIRDKQTGVVVYAKLENDELISTGYRVGSVDPASIGLQPWTNISKAKQEQLRNDFLKNISKPNGEKPRDLAKGGWNNGTLNNIVVYIRFADEDEFSSDATYNDLFNQDNGEASMYGYFKALSNEKTLIPSTFYPAGSGNIIVSYQDMYPRSYFQPYDYTTNPDGYEEWERPEREHALLARAVNAIKNQIPTTLDLDFNGDGLVDNVCFVLRGASGAWSSLLWGHRWALYNEYVTINGTQVWDYNVIMEDFLDGSYGNGNRSVSVLSHEMSHTLSLPDLYRYYDKTIDPVGTWSLMCSDRNPSQFPTIWLKYKYGGWLDNIPTITEGGTYTLHNVWSETNCAYKIASPNSSKEFFIVEYRDKNVFWDSEIPGSGLIIYRIDSDYDGNAGGPPDELYIFRPGGNHPDADGEINTAFFSQQSGRTVFNDTSDPPCFLSDGQPGDIHIRNIGASGGETMSFEVVINGIKVDPTKLDFDKIKVGTTSAAQTATISGEGLTGNITWVKSGADASAFDVTETSWDPAIGGTLSVSFSPTQEKNYNASLIISSAGVANKTILLTGIGTLPEAIDEQDATIGITIYPNPTEGQLTIEISDMRYEICDITIYDVYGRKQITLNSPSLRGTKQSTLNSIDISHLPNGMYFLRIGEKTVRFVKQ